MLVVTADDLGYSIHRDKAILQLFEIRAITAVSLLINHNSTNRALHEIKKRGIPVGLHLNLTEGVPLSKHAASLVGTDGQMHGKMGFRKAFSEGKVLLPHIEAEIDSQLQWATDNGLSFSHVDGHQHVHVLPGIRDLLAKLMNKHNVKKVRVPDDSLSLQYLDGARRDFIGTVVADAKLARVVFSQAGLHTTSAFIGNSLMGSSSSVAHLREILQQIPRGATVEWMVHPGYADPDYGDDFNRSKDREAELETLRNPKLKEVIAELNFKLVPWSEI